MHLLRRRATAALAGLAALLGSADIVAAQALDLFRTATPVEQAAQKDQRPGRAEKRSRIVALNAAAISPKATSATPDAISSPELRIALFPGVVATVRRTDVEASDDGDQVWNGDGEDASATLVVANGRVTGLVTLKGRSYRISPAGGRAHRIVEINPAKLPPDGPLKPAPKRPERSESKRSDAAPAAAGRSKIRVLIAYTRKAARKSDDIGADARLAVALANKAYKAGDVKIDLQLAGAIEVAGFSEPRSDAFDVSLDAVTAGTGAFSEVAARRDADKADLVVLLIDDPQYCGLGWYVEKPTESDADRGFSVVAWDCVPYHSVAHEMGHNMGLEHDRYVEIKAPKSRYNFGFVNVKKRKRDIMSYNNKCADRGVTCDRINLFSQPSKKVGGEPFGAKPGVTAGANAARRLNETRAVIASYR